MITNTKRRKDCQEMCFSQFMEVYGWQIVLSVLSGLVTGALTSFAVTRHFKRKDERDVIIQTAKDLARECHILLDLSDKLISQLALRKYVAYRIILLLRDLAGEVKRRTRNEETLKAKLSEISKETLSRLCIAIHNKKVDEKTKKRNIRHLGKIIKAVDTCIESADGLCLSFEKIENLHLYVSNLELITNLTYEKFMETLENEECEHYKSISEGREKLKDALFALVSAIVTTPRA